MRRLVTDFLPNSKKLIILIKDGYGIANEKMVELKMANSLSAESTTLECSAKY